MTSYGSEVRGSTRRMIGDGHSRLQCLEAVDGRNADDDGRANNNVPGDVDVRKNGVYFLHSIEFFYYFFFLSFSPETRSNQSRSQRRRRRREKDGQRP